MKGSPPVSHPKSSPLSGDGFSFLVDVQAQNPQRRSMTPSVGVKPSLSGCRSSAATPWTVDSSFTWNHLLPVSEVHFLTTLLNDSFNKAHYLTVLKQSNLAQRTKKTSLPTHLNISICKEPMSKLTLESTVEMLRIMCAMLKWTVFYRLKSVSSQIIEDKLTCVALPLFINNCDFLGG